MTVTPAQLERTVKHGAYSSLKLAPRAGELAEDLRSIVPLGTEADSAAIAILGMTLARIERASEWLDEHGLLDEGGEPRPVLKVLSAWENTACRLLHALGCTPLSRASLGLDVAKISEIAGRMDLSQLTEVELAQFYLLATKAERTEAA